MKDVTNITPATINWKDGTPYSETFDDYYFSSENGMEETDYVFLQHNELQQRWSSWQDTPGSVFTIAETGFGAGLNFLCAWQLWHQQNFNHSRLHFVSVDKSPLQQSDLKKAYTKWPILKSFCDELLSKYPPLVPGFHTIELAEGKIRLTLIFSDATEAYQQVQGRVDAWFLDGFAPSRNPDMWSSSLFTEVARLSDIGTTFSTFSASGIVINGLTKVGFKVDKHPNVDPKCEICYGKFAKETEHPSHLLHNQKPWFSEPTCYNTPGTAAVIGGGIAGASIARNLANRGWLVHIIEKHKNTAQEGSGNPTGVTFTKLSQYDNPQNRFYQLAYLYSTPLLLELLSNSPFIKGKDWDLNGVIRLAYCEKERKEQVALVNSGRWPQDIAIPLSAEETTTLIDFPCDTPALLLKQGGWLRPADAVNSLLDHPNITVECNTQLKELVQIDDQASSNKHHLKQAYWQLTTQKDGNNTQLTSDIVVLANSFGASTIKQTEHLPLRSVRGQVSFVPATEKSQHLKYALNYEGYTAPARDGFHCVGATFHPKEKHNTLEQKDQVINLTNLATGLKSFADAINADQQKSNANLKGRVGFRCQTPDYLPILGPAPCIDTFLHDYAPLRKGLLRDPMPIGTYHQGLYVSLAHGSRGITSAPYCAEILTNIIMGDVKATDNQVLEALHPARFLIRDIKRRKI